MTKKSFSHRNSTHTRRAKEQAFKKASEGPGAFMNMSRNDAKEDPSNPTENANPAGVDEVPQELKHLFPGYDFSLLGNAMVRSFMYNFRQGYKDGKEAALFGYVRNFPFSDIFCTPTRLMGKEKYEDSVPPAVPRVPALLIMEVNMISYFFVRQIYQRNLRDLKRKKALIYMPESPAFLFDVAHSVYKKMLGESLRSVVLPFNMFRDAFKASEAAASAANGLFHDVMGRNLHQWVLAHELFFFKMSKLINYMEFYLEDENVKGGKHYHISKPFSILSEEGMRGGLHSNTYYFFDRLYHFTGHVEMYSWEELSHRERLAHFIHYGKFNEEFFKVLIENDKEIKANLEKKDSDLLPHTPSSYPLLESPSVQEDPDDQEEPADEQHQPSKSQTEQIPQSASHQSEPGVLEPAVQSEDRHDNSTCEFQSSPTKPTEYDQADQSASLHQPAPDDDFVLVQNKLNGLRLAGSVHQRLPPEANDEDGDYHQYHSP